MAPQRIPTAIPTVQLTGDLAHDVGAFLCEHGFSRTLEHSRMVAVKAAQLAHQFGVDAEDASAAAWLHDISVLIPNEERIALSEAWGMTIFVAERQHPMLLHQRHSAILARDLFGIQDAGILAAIACHTTLQARASELSKVLFVADKLAWDQDGTPPYGREMELALSRSLDQAALVYIQWLHVQRSTLRAVHHWLMDAYQDLASAPWQ